MHRQQTAGAYPSFLSRKRQKWRRKTLLERQIPEWYARQQAEKHLLCSVVRYDIGEQAQKTSSEWSKSFSDPLCAEQLFIKMYAENKHAAFWYTKNNAKVFGKTELSSPPTFPTGQTFWLTAQEIAHIRPEKSFAIYQINGREIEDAGVHCFIHHSRWFFISVALFTVSIYNVSDGYTDV